MTPRSLDPPKATPQVNFDTNKVRTLVAEYLGIDAKQVTNEAHLNDDLGLDWLERLELMILIEEKFAGVEISENDANQMLVVGDLIRYLESANKEQIGERNSQTAEALIATSAVRL